MKNCNYIRIHPSGPSPIRFHVASKHEMFKNDVIVNITDDKIVFSRPTIDYMGKTIKPHKITGEWYDLLIYGYLKEGKYFFDEEESNEDQIVVYLTQDC